MKLKTLLLIVAVLAALSAGAWFLNRPAQPSTADARIGRPVVTRETVEKTARLKLSANGKTVELAHAGGAWTVPGYHDLPADFGKLSSFIDELTAAKIDRLVTSTPERIARLKFKDTQIALLDAAGGTLTTVTLGKNADTGGRFLRFGTENKAYLARLDATPDTEPRNWVNSALTRFPIADVAKLTLTFPDAAPVTVSRAKKEDAFAAETTPASQQLKTTTVDTLLGGLGALIFTETAAPADAKVVAARTATVTLFDGKTFTISLGREPEKKVLKADALKPIEGGPAALAGTLTRPPSTADAGPAKIVEPLTETIPAGPVYAFIAHSDPTAPINAMMTKRAFQIDETTFTQFPATSAALFEPIPTPAAPPTSP